VMACQGRTQPTVAYGINGYQTGSELKANPDVKAGRPRGVENAAQKEKPRERRDPAPRRRDRDKLKYDHVTQGPEGLKLPG
jgi:hypothetical protein